MNVQVQRYTKDIELNIENRAIADPRVNSSIIDPERKP